MRNRVSEVAGSIIKYSLDDVRLSTRMKSLPAMIFYLSLQTENIFSAPRQSVDAIIKTFRALAKDSAFEELKY